MTTTRTAYDLYRLRRHDSAGMNLSPPRLPSGVSSDLRSGGKGRSKRVMAGVPRPSVVSSSLETSPNEGGVLVIEDHEDARRALVDLLELWGNETAASGDGRAGADLALAGDFDVVLVDLDLPSLDGFGVAKELRRKLAGSCPYLVSMTGFGQHDDKTRALAAGFDEHLSKPVDLERLRGIIESHSSG